MIHFSELLENLSKQSIRCLLIEIVKYRYIFEPHKIFRKILRIRLIQTYHNYLLIIKMYSEIRIFDEGQYKMEYVYFFPVKGHDNLYNYISPPVWAISG